MEFVSNNPIPYLSLYQHRLSRQIKPTKTKMKQSLFFAAIVCVLGSSACKLTSVTTIGPNDSFVLGNNTHGKFSASLTNTSKEDIEVYEAPVGGGKHSTVIVKPGKTVKAKVDANTALIVQNKSGNSVNVKLKVKGDTGLSMGYQGKK
jgi:hypothetical protein